MAMSVPPMKACGGVEVRELDELGAARPERHAHRVGLAPRVVVVGAVLQHAELVGVHPEGDGLEVLRELRLQRPDQDVGVLGMVGRCVVHPAGHELAAGAQALVPPEEVDEVVALAHLHAEQRAPAAAAAEGLGGQVQGLALRPALVVVEEARPAARSLGRSHQRRERLAGPARRRGRRPACAGRARAAGVRDPAGGCGRRPCVLQGAVRAGTAILRARSGPIRGKMGPSATACGRVIMRRGERPHGVLEDHRMSTDGVWGRRDGSSRFFVVLAVMAGRPAAAGRGRRPGRLDRHQRSGGHRR